MIKTFEITTIDDDSQTYEIHDAGVLNRFVRNKGYDALVSTGLDKAIRTYPSILKMWHDEEGYRHSEFVQPKRLRLVYDDSRIAMSTVPILRICPMEDEQIYIGDYKPEMANLPLEETTFSLEFEGSLDLRFSQLQVFLYLRNFEKGFMDYYCRNLKENRELKSPLDKYYN